jgi:hypothetical protein
MHRAMQFKGSQSIGAGDTPVPTEGLIQFNRLKSTFIDTLPFSTARLLSRVPVGAPEVFVWIGQRRLLSYSQKTEIRQSETGKRYVDRVLNSLIA